eukprot:TRINITY_DN6873_c0_g1_i1.p1 TRINITY_DN6873_c0_g1~~TRINITY_DN6873_c0_g1_i1.p1  ORF type:complete len:459 (-),score=74.47 TRINITY_DN6873_c0_g1_i1:887-2263(-)
MMVSLERDSSDRSGWRHRVVKANPELAELKERIFPLNRAAKFAELYQPMTRGAQEGLSKQHIHELVYNHLLHMGYRKSAEAMMKESPFEVEGHHSDDSALVYYLRNGVAQCENVYSLAVAEKDTDEVDLEEQLFNIGLLEEQEEDEEDIYIWSEPPDENIHKEDRPGGGYDIKAGSLNKLVEKLTDVSHTDLMFMKTFLMTYQSFTTPQKLLNKLFERYHVPPSSAEDWQQHRKVVQLRVTNALKKWLEDYYSDFTQGMLRQLQDFIESSDTPKIHAVSVEKSLKKGSRPRVRYAPKTTPPEPVVPKSIFSSKLSLFDIDDMEIARQITLIEFENFEKIRPQELLNTAWSKAKLKHTAPNVLNMIHNFNHFSLAVATCVLKCKKVRTRIKMMTKFINIGLHLRNLNNFNSLMEILAGLNIASIFRLKHTKAGLSDRYNFCVLLLRTNLCFFFAGPKNC